jgi:ATP-binding cassette subfamily B protein
LNSGSKEQALILKIPGPFIAHVKIPCVYGFVDHYVVVTKVGKKKLTVYDHDTARRVYSLKLEDFISVWTGYVVFITPNESFTLEKGKGNLLFKFLPVLLPHKKTMIMVSIFSFLLILFGITSSFYFKYVFDEVIFAKARFTLVALSIGVMSIVIIQTIVDALRSILLNHFSYKADLQLNFSYVMHILKLPLSFFDSRKTGEILSRLEDIGKIRGALSGAVLSVFMDIIMLLVVGPFLWKINGFMFSVSIINVLIVSVIVFIFSKIFRKYYTKLRIQEADVSSYLVEAISGASTVKSLNAEKIVFEEYEKRQMKAIWTSWKASRFGILQGFLSGLINSVSGIVIFWIGSSSILDGVFTFGTLISFNALSGYFTGPLFRLVNLQSGLQEAFVAAERVGDILELEPEQSEEDTLLKPVQLKGKIDFTGVTFRYGTRLPVYENIDLHIGAGTWVGFVGPSGSGKTTLIKLLMKFYIPEKGSITMDDHDIRDIDVFALRSKIGYVPQDIFLFSGTVAENIALHHHDATLEEIIAASERAGAHDFISALPNRYNTKIGEHGSTLSGGEKQRLALARALLCSPDVLILDEATSNLDTLSEHAVHTVIENLRNDKMTVIIIAHRLSTVMSCDTIFVMDKGKIVQSGCHSDLVEIDGLYKSLWKGMAV